MYAESFDVRPWLEPACKWLRWAMQTVQAGRLSDARYNLQQFWKALESFKAKATTSRDWSEVLLLDSQSQWTLGTLCQAEQNAVMQSMANYSAVKQTGGTLMPWVKWIDWAMQKAFDTQDQALAAAAKKVQELGAQGEQANRNARALAKQAEQADAQARAQEPGLPKSQVSNTVRVTDYTAPMITQRNTAAGKITGDILRQDREAPSFPKLPNPFSLEFWGLPVWAWGVLGLGAVLLLTPSTPSFSLSTGRRA